MDAATAADVPVIVVRHGSDDPESPDLQAGHARLGAASRDRAALARSPRREDVPGSFTGTPLESILAAAGVDTVAITGYMTHMCVDTTSRQAAHLGLSVEILSDATGTLPLENSGGAAGGEELHRATLVAQGQFFADVVSTDDWLGRIAG